MTRSEQRRGVVGDGIAGRVRKAPRRGVDRQLGLGGSKRGGSAARGRRLVARRDLVAGVAGVEGLGGGVGRPGVGALEPAGRAGELGDLLDHAGSPWGGRQQALWMRPRPAPAQPPYVHLVAYSSGATLGKHDEEALHARHQDPYVDPRRDRQPRALRARTRPRLQHEVCRPPSPASRLFQIAHSLLCPKVEASRHLYALGV